MGFSDTMKQFMRLYRSILGIWQLYGLLFAALSCQVRSSYFKQILKRRNLQKKALAENKFHLKYFNIQSSIFVCAKNDHTIFFWVQYWKNWWFSEYKDGILRATVIFSWALIKHTVNFARNFVWNRILLKFTF